MIDSASSYRTSRRAEALRLAETLSPVLNEYVAASDQATPASQKRLCDEIRAFCAATGLAVVCPRTGLPAQLYDRIRTDRGNEKRVGFRHGDKTTAYTKEISGLVLTPAEEDALPLQHLVDRLLGRRAGRSR